MNTPKRIPKISNVLGSYRIQFKIDNKTQWQKYTKVEAFFSLLSLWWIVLNDKIYCECAVHTSIHICIQNWFCQKGKICHWSPVYKAIDEYLVYQYAFFFITNCCCYHEFIRWNFNSQYITQQPRHPPLYPSSLHFVAPGCVCVCVEPRPFIPPHPLHHPSSAL